MGSIYCLSPAPIDHKLATKSVKCPPSPGRASTPRRSGGAAPWSRRDNTGRLSPEYTPAGGIWARRAPGLRPKFSIADTPSHRFGWRPNADDTMRYGSHLPMTGAPRPVSHRARHAPTRDTAPKQNKGRGKDISIPCRGLKNQGLAAPGSYG